MSSGNFQFERKRSYELRQRDITGTYTVKTGTATYNGIIDNPIQIADPAASFTLTVPDGAYPGQTLFIGLTSNASSVTVTVTASTGSGGDSTMATAGMYMYLVWVDSTTGWVSVKESVTS